MPTLVPKEHEIERKWFIVDADGQVLGRLASRVASILRGKHKQTFVPHLDVGDHVVVLNAAKVHLTGRKLKDKLYRWHTGDLGGPKEAFLEPELDTPPQPAAQRAVAETPAQKRRRARLAPKVGTSTRGR